MPFFLAGLGAFLTDTVGPWLVRLAIAHAIGVVIKLFAQIGVAFFAYKEIIQPLIDHFESGMNGMPADLAKWMGALGIDKAASIMIGAYTVSAGYHFFFGKATS